MAHIRAKRGTVSALTADADEFGTVRARQGARTKHRPRSARAGGEIRVESGGTGTSASAARGCAFRGRSVPARPVRLDCFGFLTAGGEPSTMTVRVQFSDRSFDRATKHRAHFNSESHNIARYSCVLSCRSQKKLAIDHAHSPRMCPQFDHSQFSAPPVWYSITRVSKKLRSFFRSIISLIHGNGLSPASNSGSMPICWQRRFAM